MKTNPFFFFFGLFSLFLFAGQAKSQVLADTASQAVQKQSSAAGLFESDEILEITLRGKIKDVVNDRGESPTYHPLELVFNEPGAGEVIIPVNVKTRGHFRKMTANCYYPPLQIQFPKGGPQLATIFKEQEKLKLVMPCKDDDFVVREWLPYKIYNLVTPMSYRARLVKVRLDDSKSKKVSDPFYGILLEETGQLAKRHNMVSVNRQLAPQQTMPGDFLNMTVFQYLIGNTDWSIQYLQNIKLLAKDSMAVPLTVPYDFDHSGLVSAPYAKPAEALELSSVRERRYRGYCETDMTTYDSVLALYNRLKKDIYDLVNNSQVIDPKFQKSTIKYFDEFYATINDPKALQREFSYPCRKDKSANVVIRGLKDGAEMDE